MDFDLQLRGAIYRHFVEHAGAPSIRDMTAALGCRPPDVVEGYSRLAARRLIVLMPDGESIRMAPPFSASETQHQVHALGKRYFANCAWDAFGIPAALHVEAEVVSRCEQTYEPLRLRVDAAGPQPSAWRFHSAVPPVHWWRDIVYT